MKLLRIIISILLAYAALYAAIWLHELGHAALYYYYGCKADLFRLYVPLHFAAASPEPVDAACTASMGAHRHFVAAMGGTFANLVLAAGAWLLYRRLNSNGWAAFFVAVFLLSNLTEAASYLTLNNIRPMGDIIPVQQFFPAFRIPLGLLGICLAVAVMNFLKTLPERRRRGLGIFCLVTAACMFGMRLAFAS